MTEHDTETLWVAGWMWGKYPEHAPSEAHRLPQDETEALEWLEGFRWGATESCQFHRLWEWLNETLVGHEAAIRLVNRVGGNP